jgi:hypothetical protein
MKNASKIGTAWNILSRSGVFVFESCKRGATRLLPYLLMAIAIPAIAGPLDEAKAQAHLKAIADGDIEVLMRDYAEEAFMEWVGGPLDGRYRGRSAIRAVWQNFIAANDGQPRPAKVGKPQAYANAKGAAIANAVEYGGKTPVKVWHVLVFRDGELVTELWQIAPALKVDQ